MKEKTVTFGLMSDLHMDIMHDGSERLLCFLDACREEQVDFIVNNGDFCYPKNTSKCLCSAENMPVNLCNAMRVSTPVPKLEMLARFNAFEKPHYHVLGNHEMDFCSKEETIRLYGMPGRYYDFHCKGWHFLVLDSNHYQNQKGEICDYYYGDYFDYGENLPYLDEEQLQWMKKVITDSPEPVIMFSHQPLIPVHRGILNYGRLDNMLDGIQRKEPGKIRMCIYGHVHLDTFQERRGILHYSINSISNHWIGPKYACHRYSEEVERKFPNLQYVFPYQKPIFAIVTLSADGVTIKGRDGRFERPDPAECGFYEYEVSACIKTREAKWPL